MFIKPGQGLVNGIFCGQGFGCQHLINFPITLAVNTDLGTGIKRFEDCDTGITPGNQING